MPLKFICKRFFRQRFVKFGLVGGSGVLVNLAVLALLQEYGFGFVENDQMRLNLSLPVAIFFATLHNFYWNRRWTWGDRKETIQKSAVLQLTQYFGACWIAIVVQFGLTKLLAPSIHYLPANFVAIGAGAVVNYLLNDRWTFKFPMRLPQPNRRVHKPPKKPPALNADMSGYSNDALK
jgi:dolichol-phosphate mannosyltransferase